MNSLESKIYFQAIVWRMDLRGRVEETERGERLFQDSDRGWKESPSPFVS